MVNISEDVKICQKLYMSIYNFCAESFKEYILSNPSYIMEYVTKEMCLN